jgi:hypothetical protein
MRVSMRIHKGGRPALNVGGTHIPWTVGLNGKKVKNEKTDEHRHSLSISWMLGQELLCFPHTHPS